LHYIVKLVIPSFNFLTRYILLVDCDDFTVPLIRIYHFIQF
jgi:hypothetical protein